MLPTLSKKQFADLVKNKILWPDWNFQLADTVDGFINTSNREVEGVVEIIIDALYQKYVEIERWIEIIDVETTDGASEGVVFLVSHHTVKSGDTIRIYGSLNYIGEYVVRSVGVNSIVIDAVFKEEEISDQVYYTVVSPDGYSESTYYYFERGSSVQPYSSLIVPKFLPLIGQRVGCKYDPRLSVAQNRKFIQSAIEVYKIKGTVLSIKRIMSLLGYTCQVYEPYKNLYRYSKSKYSGLDHYTDWGYYHHGVFEIITDGVPLSLYKDVIAGTVQPVGTRLSGLCNLTVPIVPIISNFETQRNKQIAIYQELYVKCIVSGDIYDVVMRPRTRSGSRQVTGFYIDIGIELSKTPAYRRVFDSEIFTFEDLVQEVIDVEPAGVYSKSRGAYSSSKRLRTFLPCQYTENTPLDVQLAFDVDVLSARLPARSDHAQRSGRFCVSGTPGTGWNPSRYWIYHQGPIIEFISQDQNLAKNDFDRSIIIEMSLTRESREHSYFNIFEVTQRSGQEFAFGFEVITDWQYRGPTDWDTKMYYMYDDFCRVVEFNNSSENLVHEGFDRGLVLAPVIVRHSEPNIYEKSMRSGPEVVSSFSVKIVVD
jgi:hypothetical protein